MAPRTNRRTKTAMTKTTSTQKTASSSAASSASAAGLTLYKGAAPLPEHRPVGTSSLKAVPFGDLPTPLQRWRLETKEKHDQRSALHTRLVHGIADAKERNAVVRSRAKRLLRESYRQHQHELTQPVDLVLVARQSVQPTVVTLVLCVRGSVGVCRERSGVGGS